MEATLVTMLETTLAIGETAGISVRTFIRRHEDEEDADGLLIGVTPLGKETTNYMVVVLAADPTPLLLTERRASSLRTNVRKAFALTKKYTVAELFPEYRMGTPIFRFLLAKPLEDAIPFLVYNRLMGDKAPFPVLLVDRLCPQVWNIGRWY